MNSKFCSKCGIEKPLSEFNKLSKGKYGHKARCKNCNNIDNTIVKLNRRAKDAGVYIEPSIDKYLNTLLEMERFCWYCGILINGSKHVDHIKPLFKGGSHSLDNIAITCGRCNDSKGTNELMLLFLVWNDRTDDRGYRKGFWYWYNVLHNKPPNGGMTR